MTVPRTSQIALGEIRGAAENILTRHYGVAPKLRLLRRRFSRYSSSYPIQNIRMLCEENGDIHLILKDLSPTAQFNFVRPKALYDPNREIDVYRDVLTPDLGTPLYYGSVVTPEQNRYWLFLERISGAHLWQMGDLEFWKAAARWLAVLHSRSEAPERALRLDKPLIRYDREYFARSLAGAEQILSKNSNGLDPSSLRQFGKLVDRYDQILDRLTSLPQCFVHGDFFPSNVLVRTTNGKTPISPIDWELAGIGPGLLDLAALTAGEWDPSDRTAMISVYRDSLESSNGWPPSPSEFAEAVDCCMLQTSIQFLSWATDWRPPPQHSKDWFRTALEYSTKLGL